MVKYYYTKIKPYRKIMASFFLLAVCVLFSMDINYKQTGVFINNKRRLPIYSVDTKEKKIAISFDASWGTDYTMNILDTLDKYNVKATFFLVGKWVDDFQDDVKEINKRGHEIGNHSDKHPDMTTISREQIIKEIAATDAKILTITGKKTTLFRCPEGSYNDKVIQAVEDTNHYCIQWNIDSIDWKEQGADKEYERVVKRIKPGSILLFHNSAKYTPQNLPKIIEKLKADGYQFVKISDLIYKDKYQIDNEGKQIHL